MRMSMKRSCGLSADAIKLIAVIAMTADHIAWCVAPGYDTRLWVMLLHIAGRITAPVMWFFVAEGYCRTHNLRRYALRLFILSVISHFAYCFCFGRPFIPTGVLGQTSIAPGLLLGLAALYINDSEKLSRWQKCALTALVFILSIPADYSFASPAAILLIGTSRNDPDRQLSRLFLCTVGFAVMYFFCFDRVYTAVQLFACLSIPLLSLYNGERGGSRAVSRLFYLYYPLHLIVLGLLK